MTLYCFQQAISLAKKGLFREAAVHMDWLVNQHAQRAEYWHFYSVVLLNLRHNAKAIESSKKAIALDPSNPDYRVQFAMALQQNLLTREALIEAQKIDIKTANNPETLNALGNVYSACGQLHDAQHAYEKAVDRAPDRMLFQFNLATAWRSNGQPTKAEAIYDTIIAHNPHDYEAYANRSQLRKQKPDNNHISDMQALLDHGINHWRDESQICYALSKECEDIEQYAQSFDYLSRGANLRRQHMQYNVAGDLQAIDKIINVFSQKTIDDCRTGHHSIEPIFVLGLPRTGTTLVEHIINSHSDVYSAGELQQFASQMINLVIEKNPGEKLDKMTMIEKSINIDFEQLGRNYIDSTRPLTGNTPHFIDKLPLNYLYIGLIKMALPNAKIVHLTRHPMDTCYAIYKTLFRDAYPFSYNLTELGRYYLAYHQLMEHWRKILPSESIFDLNYEHLVQNQETQSRQLIQFCGLQWQDECLHFYNNRQASTTASASQVRQPIYSSSVQKWRHYENQLQPLAEILVNGGVDIC